NILYVLARHVHPCIVRHTEHHHHRIIRELLGSRAREREPRLRGPRRLHRRPPEPRSGHRAGRGRARASSGTPVSAARPALASRRRPVAGTMREELLPLIYSALASSPNAAPRLEVLPSPPMGERDQTEGTPP